MEHEHPLELARMEGARTMDDVTEAEAVRAHAEDDPR
jgi:hypothetical protein